MIKTTTTITCDTCKEEVNLAQGRRNVVWETFNHDWLPAQRVRNESHFCSLACMAEWADTMIGRGVK